MWDSRETTFQGGKALCSTAPASVYRIKLSIPGKENFSLKKGQAVGTSYFAEIRNFLLCVDKRERESRES
jgi:hypothetical protein